MGLTSAESMGIEGSCVPCQECSLYHGEVESCVLIQILADHLCWSVQFQGTLELVLQLDIVAYGQQIRSAQSPCGRCFWFCGLQDLAMLLLPSLSNTVLQM